MESLGPIELELASEAALSLLFLATGFAAYLNWQTRGDAGASR